MAYLDGCEQMDLEKVLSWSSPIGVGVFFVGAGILIYLGALALQILRG
jgi:hypothetical protein